MVQSKVLTRIERSTPRVGGLLVRLKIGAGDGARTRNIQLGRLALYQLSYPRLIRGKYIEGVSRHSPHDLR